MPWLNTPITEIHHRQPGRCLYFQTQSGKMTIRVFIFHQSTYFFSLILCCKGLRRNPPSIFVGVVLEFSTKWMQKERKGRPLDPIPPCFLWIISLSAFPWVSWSLIAPRGCAMRGLWELYRAWELLCSSEAWQSILWDLATPSRSWPRLELGSSTSIWPLVSLLVQDQGALYYFPPVFA